MVGRLAYALVMIIDGSGSIGWLEGPVVTVIVSAMCS